MFQFSDCELSDNSFDTTLDDSLVDKINKCSVDNLSTGDVLFDADETLKLYEKYEKYDVKKEIPFYNNFSIKIKNVRCVLIDWLIFIVDKYKLEQEVFFLTVKFIDNYLLYTSCNLTLNNGVLLLTASILIADKFHSQNYISMNVLQNLTDLKLSKKHIIEMELQILKVIDYRLNHITISYYSNMINLDEDCKLLFTYCTYLTQLYDDLLKYVPSKLVCASLYLTYFSIGNKDYSKIFEIYNYELLDVKDCIIDIYSAYVDNKMSLYSFVLKNKFKKVLPLIDPSNLIYN